MEEDAPEDAPEENLHQRRARKILQNLAEKMRGLIANPKRPKRAKDTDSLMLRILRVPLVPFAGLVLLPALNMKSRTDDITTVRLAMVNSPAQSRNARSKSTSLSIGRRMSNLSQKCATT